MKKLLGIVVLGFGLIILNSCGQTYEAFQNEATNKGLGGFLLGYVY